MGFYLYRTAVSLSSEMPLMVKLSSVKEWPGKLRLPPILVLLQDMLPPSSILTLKWCVEISLYVKITETKLGGAYATCGVSIRTWLKFLLQVLYLTYVVITCPIFTKLALIVHLDLLMHLKYLDAETGS